MFYPAVVCVKDAWSDEFADVVVCRVAKDARKCDDEEEDADVEGVFSCECACGEE